MNCPQPHVHFSGQSAMHLNLAESVTQSVEAHIEMFKPEATCPKVNTLFKKCASKVHTVFLPW